MDARDRALLQIGIAAALADGMCDERERSHLDAMARAAGAESSAALGAGRTLPADIATRLLMSVPTVKSHLTHVFAKLGLSNRTELAAAATSRRTDSIAVRAGSATVYPPKR